MKKGVINI